MARAISSCFRLGGIFVCVFPVVSIWEELSLLFFEAISGKEKEGGEEEDKQSVVSQRERVQMKLNDSKGDTTKSESEVVMLMIWCLGESKAMIKLRRRSNP